MKKILLFVLTVTVLASTMVSAESTTKYKGFDIINVKVNDTALSLDVPAINMDGRTLLPLRKVAEALNSIVSWDANTKTALVIKPQVNIIFTETKDGVTSGSEPTETIPFWTEYDKFLSYVTIGGLPQGRYSLYHAIYKKDVKLSSSTPVQVASTPPEEINMTGPNSPIILPKAWDKKVVGEPALYTYIVYLKDSSNKYQPIATYSMDIK